MLGCLCYLEILPQPWPWPRIFEVCDHDHGLEVKHCRVDGCTGKWLVWLKMSACLQLVYMMTSSNGKNFPCYWPFLRGIASQRPVMWNFDVFFDLRLNKRLSNKSRTRWFETSLRSLLHFIMIIKLEIWINHWPLFSVRSWSNGMPCTASFILLPSGNKPLPEPILTNFYDAILYR